MFKTNAIKVVAFLGLLLAFVACGPSKEEQEREARFNYAKKTTSDILSVDTVGKVLEIGFIIAKNSYMGNGVKLKNMQIAVDSVYALESKKLKRCQKLSKMTPANAPVDMKDEIGALWNATCLKYQTRLESLDAFTVYLNAKTKENKAKAEEQSALVAMQSDLWTALITRLADRYGNK